MTYVSLYRKYRSQAFDEVMGQEHITKTLQNAIKLGKVAHAYLFCGTRGTGKTTTARLLAKALNCDGGPTPEPCNECDACRSITDGSAVDVIELDAASHRSVTDVKDIRDNVKFPPMVLRYKVFIIDEAHQLSSDAKDAFLKTLEEPPPYVVFVLATTEPHNIPITIRSRCQQFDFRRGSLDQIRSRLRYVVDQEGIEADDDALDLVAVNADGSWRDGLSLLEQVLAYTDKRLAADDVYKVLGTVTRDFLFRLADIIADGDEPGAFVTAAEVAESGKDMRQLLRSLAEHFRNLVFASVMKDRGERQSDNPAAARLSEQAGRFASPVLIDIVQVFSEAEREARFSDQHKLLVEMALLKAIGTARPGEYGQARAPEPQTVEEPPARKDHAPPKKLVEQPREPAAKPPATDHKPAVSARRSAASGKQDLPEFATIRGKWNQVLQHVKSIRVSAHSLIVEGVPADVRNGAIVLRFKHAGHVKLIMDETEKPNTLTKKRVLQMALERVFGVPSVGIICEHGEEGPDVERSRPEPEVHSLPLDTPQDTGEEALRNVLDIFNGEIVDD